MVKTDFSPLRHGFHFNNDFVNNILNTPFGKIESRGRCGGMAFASLDYYYAKIPVPSYKNKDFHSSILEDYIYKRSVNSLITLSSYKFINWTITKDESINNILLKTKTVEFLKLKKSIDEGNPVVLGLISAFKISQVTRNHQVVAYGYDEPSKDDSIIYIYDSNYPSEEITLKLSNGSANLKESNGGTWRGFFVQDYRFKQPPVIIQLKP